MDDPRIEETNNDEGFTYYLKSEAIKDLRASMGTYVEGEAIEKDLSNLFLLQSVPCHNQFVRTSHIDPNGQSVEATEYFEEWEQAPKHTNT
ncbi:hypothetical protein [Pseudogracilibacillus sp. SO30301A]|uniref:hypothetical protein n=1 Tax=Pseudogracilibacillus sp. SO30301A TaxID=3098291 RepID=UPI00300E56CE